MIGKVLYIAMMCRIDVAHPVSILSQFMLNPNDEHIKALERVIVYLVQTQDKTLEYVPSANLNPEPIALMGFVDASSFTFVELLS